MTFHARHDPLVELDAAKAAIFLDFDGTLIELAQTPDGIDVPADLPDLLHCLARRTAGALALVSGRAVADLRRYLPDAPGCLVGNHGCQITCPGAPAWHHPLIGANIVAALQRDVQSLADSAPGLIAEPKPAGAVLHYRRAPAEEPRLARAMTALADAAPGIELHRAKMALELRPDDAGKDRAIARLMQAAPFAGRVPVMLGDDLTDEPAMDFAQQGGGLACKVGSGDTIARHRRAGPADVHDLIRRWVS
jgi:trehalose 6-phosphate phosphatase